MGIRCLMATGQIDAKTKERAAMVQPLGWLPKPYGNGAGCGQCDALQSGFISPRWKWKGFSSSPLSSATAANRAE
jgi:hypothetical protein